MKIITSRTNPIVKQICALHTKKGRELAGFFIAEGMRTISTLFKNHSKLEQLYITEGNAVDAIDMPCAQDCITYVTPEVMHKISGTQNPCGYLAVFAIPPASNSLTNNGIVLANITDPGNMGTLIRSAATFAYSTVIIVDGTDPWSPKVIHASAGTIGAVNIIQCSWQELMQIKKNKKLCALVVKNGKNPHELKNLDAYLVIGNEAHGIPDSWLNDCELHVTIPMPGNTESLNAAVAGSIALYAMSQK